MAQVMDRLGVARETVEAFNDADWDRYEAVLARDTVYEEPATGAHAEGPAEVLDVNRAWKRAFPDAKATIDRAIEAPDAITLEITYRAHHEGPLATPAGEVAPTGREITVHAAEILDIRDGKVVADRNYFDMASLMEQLDMT
jgi:steroid delta-isomerase-like uncharacterized protein